MPSAFTISHFMPVVSVDDLEAAIAFYGRLGFAEVWRYGDPATDAGVGRYGCMIMLSLIEPDQRIEKSSFYVFVSNVDAFHDHCAAALNGVSGATAGPLRDTDYNMRDFELHDPWGHRLTFGEGLEYVRRREGAS